MSLPLAPSHKACARQCPRPIGRGGGRGSRSQDDRGSPRIASAALMSLMQLMSLLHTINVITHTQLMSLMQHLHYTQLIPALMSGMAVVGPVLAPRC